MQKSDGLGRDIFLLVAANAIWGCTDVVAKLAFAEITPPAVAWIRLTIALAVFSPSIWKYRADIPRTFSNLLPFIGLGLTGFFLNLVIQYAGLKFAPASHSTTLRVLESLLIVMLSALILREKLGKMVIIALASGIVGTIMVLDVDFRNLSLFTAGYRLGDTVIIAGILVECFYTIIGKRVLAKTSPILMTALACLIGWLMMSAFYGHSIASEFIRKPPSALALLSCAYLGIVATGFGYWVYSQVLSRRPSNRVAISIMIQPVVGIPLAALVFHDSITAKFLIGAALIIGGVYIAMRGNS